MNKKQARSGISILVFTVLLSSFLLVCTGVWRATAYFVDFAFQKQVYLQKCYFLEGVMRWAVRWIVAEWDGLQELLAREEALTYSLSDWPPRLIMHLNEYQPKIMLYKKKDTAVVLKITLERANKEEVFAAWCTLRKETIGDIDNQVCRYAIYDWYVGA